MTLETYVDLAGQFIWLQPGLPNGQTNKFVALEPSVTPLPECMKDPQPKITDDSLRNFNGPNMLTLPGMIVLSCFRVWHWPQWFQMDVPQFVEGSLLHTAPIAAHIALSTTGLGPFGQITQLHLWTRNTIFKNPYHGKIYYYPYVRWKDAVWAFDPKVGLVVAGGCGWRYGDNTRRCFTDVYMTRDSGMTWEDLPPTRYPGTDGEMIFINDSLLLHQPDNNLQIQMQFLDLDSKTWREGPQWKYPRGHHHFGVVTRKSGEKEIVVVGGHVVTGSFYKPSPEFPADTQTCCEPNGLKITKSVEIYNLANNTVRDG